MKLRRRFFPKRNRYKRAVNPVVKMACWAAQNETVRLVADGCGMLLSLAGMATLMLTMGAMLGAFR